MPSVQELFILAPSLPSSGPAVFWGMRSDSGSGVVSAGHAFGQISEKLLNDAFSGVGMVMLIVFLVLSWILSRKLERIAEQS